MRGDRGDDRGADRLAGLFGERERERAPGQSFVLRRAEQRIESAALNRRLRCLGEFAQPVPFGLAGIRRDDAEPARLRSEEHTSELQSLMRISYAVFCLKKKKKTKLKNKDKN